jgi:hypothetical protein
MDAKSLFLKDFVFVDAKAMAGQSQGHEFHQSVDGLLR